MRARFAVSISGFFSVLWLAGCQTGERVPSYLPSEVVANQNGSVVATTQATTLQGGGAGRQYYGQPDGVSVSDKGLREATLIWAPTQDDVYRYRIERAETQAGPFSKVTELSPGKLQFRDSGTLDAPLKDDTTYYYRIVALITREGPESVPSRIVQTHTAPPPVPPLEVKATATGSREVTVSWASSTSDGVTQYRVERTPATSPGQYEKVGQTRASPWVDGGTPESTLKDSALYRYRVITINRVSSESAPSQVSEVKTLPPPAVVQKVAAVSDEVRCVPLSWAPSPEQDVVRYDVYRARAAEGPFEKIGAVQRRESVAYLDGGANPGDLEDEASYFYRVRAVNAVTSESADSEVARGVTRGIPPEVEAVSLVGNRPREMPISWLPDSDKAVQGYEIWRSEEGSDDWVQLVRLAGREVTNYLDRGEIKPRAGLGQLKDATVYLYKVIAFNKANVRSSASAPVSARTKYRPVAPSGLQLTTNMPLAIRLEWKANPERDIAYYVVECSDSEAGSFRKLVTVQAERDGGLSAREMALNSGVVRYYRVKAMDKEGLESDWSAVGRGCAKPVPDAPLEIKAEPVGTNVRVVWKAPPQPDVRRYKVWRKKFIGWELISATEQTNYLFEFTDLSKQMTIAVSAVDKDELESDKSESLEIKPGL